MCALLFVCLFSELCVFMYTSVWLRVVPWFALSYVWLFVALLFKSPCFCFLNRARVRVSCLCVRVLFVCRMVGRLVGWINTQTS